ncbi:MAG: hypothetical protein ACKO9I_11215 [Sphaerospermopsis kisseleviana]|uniref:Uncharacterized protein n=2 Tax=Sphaerospermopsis TaxID=752201 RepID=A0A479ZYC2_9CYAN|nr:MULTISPECIES: hypothetical protein [Sphaerospermopsis]MEB3150954.1 hypothetical protein [Sphaerospermopsis sp.]BAZ79722.1 hypothetical protein NIES73_09670 [Sphaerospermopsis kisseleviana NIES-73]MBC5796122.1 hypothetical protein [Sphaerospermopsis sp. LEGE 00249]MDB9442841.1 hypothetical protein [Sphaerospermopsis kisseleviana CS-549]GCL36596.1 hypothetical protein SR1949_17010 [Sphaerospermopsis reniformis]
MRISFFRFLLTSLWLMVAFLATNLQNRNTVLAEAPPEVSQLVNGKQINVSKSEFGVRIVDSQGKANFFPTTKVPLKKGDAYGWRMTLQNYQGKVKWREVLRLPKAPETWATPEKDENFSLSADGSTAITTRTQTVKNGVIENYWKIAPGDPLGKHRIEVYVDDRLISIFEFETVEF